MVVAAGHLRGHKYANMQEMTQVKGKGGNAWVDGSTKTRETGSCHTRVITEPFPWL